MVELDRFLIAELGKPWAWGLRDCTMFVADWILTATGIDPANDARRTYWDASTAAAVARRAGGMIPLVSRRLNDFFVLTEAPVTGDVGIVDVLERECAPMLGVTLTMAIRLGPLWVARAQRGISGRDWPTVKAWRIECRKSS